MTTTIFNSAPRGEFRNVLIAPSGLDRKPKMVAARHLASATRSDAKKAS